MDRRVVVTGLGAVTPCGNSPEELWENLLAGRHGFPLHTKRRRSKGKQPRSLFLRAVRSASYAADVSDHAQCEAMVKWAKDTFGTIDVLVNNAGITRSLTYFSLSVFFIRFIFVSFWKSYTRILLYTSRMAFYNNGFDTPEKQKYLWQDGKAVYKFAVNAMADAVRNVAEQGGYSIVRGEPLCDSRADTSSRACDDSCL